MGKLLFWLVVIALAWLAWTLVRVSHRKQERAQSPGGASGADGRAAGKGDRPAALEQMVACDRCGVFLPVSDSVPGPRGRYCCVEHRDAGRR
jgi:uncharacterized protein